MSLINNMLKDLKKYENSNIEVPPIALLTPKPRQKKMGLAVKAALPLILIIILIMMVRAAWQPVTQHTASIKKIPPPHTAKTLLKPVEEMTSPWLNAVNITGITAQTKDNVTEISFLLDHDALYQLTSQPQQNEISLTIEHAQLQAELPSVINYFNSTVQGLHTQTVNGNIIFQFTLVPQAGLKYVTINTDDKKPELVIGFSPPSQETTVSSQDASAGIVKTPTLQSIVVDKYENALNTAESGQTETAIELLNDLLTAYPDYHDARVSLIALLITQGDKARANELADEGLKLNADYLPFVELKARLLSMAGRNKKALELMNHFSPTMQENPEFYEISAALNEQADNDRTAVHLYKKLLAVNPHNGNWWFGLALSLEKLGEKKSAAQAYANAIEEGQLNADSLVYSENRLQAMRGNANDKA